MRRLFPLALLLTTPACAGTFVAGGPSFDYGTLDASGVGTGVGGVLEAGFRSRASLSGAVTGALVGYRSEGDADPIFLTTLEARYLRPLGNPARRVRPFLELGGGPAMAWVAGPRNGGLVAGLGLGLEGGGEGARWWLTLRERPTLLFSGRAEVIGSTQLVFGFAP